MKISDIPFLKHFLPLFYKPFPFDGKNLNPRPSGSNFAHTLWNSFFTIVVFLWHQLNASIFPTQLLVMRIFSVNL